MALPYNSNRPQAGDLLSQSQPQLLTNFSSIKTFVDQDHVDFAGDTFGNQPGQHKQVSLGSQGTNGTDAIPVFNPLTMIGLFSQVSPAGFGAKNELYINKVNQATTVQIPATASTLSINSNPGYTTPAWTFLPSGILLKWGQSQGFSGNPTITVNTNSVGPRNFVGISLVLITPQDSAGAYNQVMGIKSVVSPSFTVYASSAPSTATFNWLAIGY